MKVYVVWRFQSDCMEEGVEGVFSTLQGAKDYVRRLQESDEVDGIDAVYTVDPCELDEEKREGV